MSRLLPAFCAAAAMTAAPSITLAQAPANADQPNLPPVVVSPSAAKKPKVVRSNERPRRALVRAAASPAPEAAKPPTEVGSSQSGAGLGGRLTGYTVDFGAPATEPVKKLGPTDRRRSQGLVRYDSLTPPSGVIRDE